MKVLITGGAGFLGSHIADTLVNRGDYVVVIDNYETGRRDNLSSHPNLKIVEGTIVDSELLDSLFHEIDLVIHAAASYKNPENWAEDAKSNVCGTINVIKSCL